MDSTLLIEADLDGSKRIETDRFGTSAGDFLRLDSLRVYTNKLRIKRRLRAEEQAAKIVLKRRLPLTLFICQTLLAVRVGRLTIQIMRQPVPALSAGSRGWAAGRLNG